MGQQVYVLYMPMCPYDIWKYGVVQERSWLKLAQTGYRGTTNRLGTTNAVEILLTGKRV